MHIDGYLTVTQAAKRLKMEPGTIRRYSSRGTLKGERLGWTLLFTEAEIARFAAEDRKCGRKKGFSPKNRKKKSVS